MSLQLQSREPALKHPSALHRTLLCRPGTRIGCFTWRNSCDLQPSVWISWWRPDDLVSLHRDHFKVLLIGNLNRGLEIRPSMHSWYFSIHQKMLSLHVRLYRLGKTFKSESINAILLHSFVTAQPSYLEKCSFYKFWSVHDHRCILHCQRLCVILEKLFFQESWKLVGRLFLILSKDIYLM